MYWTLELASKLEDAPWPATKDELIDFSIRSGAPMEVVENLQELVEEELPMLKAFILPSGHPIASKCHIARTVCRRAERNLVALSQEEAINNLHIQYLNRLSDYLFVLARAILKENNVKEIEWQKD